MTLTQKEIAFRWKVCLRTVQRELRRFNATPKDYIGIQPVFSEKAVEEIEKKRRDERAKRAGFNMKGGAK